MHPRENSGRVAAVALVVALAMTAAPGVGVAVPPPPPNPSDDELQSGQVDVEDAAERVGALSSEVASARSDLQDAQVELAETYDEVTAAEHALEQAEEAAEDAKTEVRDTRGRARAAGDRMASARDQLDEFAAASYRQGSSVGSITAYVGSESAQELLDREQLLNAAGGSQIDALENMRRARIEKSNQDAAAQAALDQAEQREQEAAEAESATESAYESAVDAERDAEERNAELLARQSDLESELDQARGELADMRDQRGRYNEWQEEKREEQRREEQRREEQRQEAQQVAGTDAPAESEEPAGADRPASSAGSTVTGVVAPAMGRITSTYGPRGGSIHYGLDVANRIGTPIVSVMDGVVVESGPASGFGLWVRVRHDSGVITVYGHNNENLVTVGERVSAGEQIATVGNRGQSTGPHLHFEVHTGGSKIDPLPWLRSNGVSM